MLDELFQPLTCHEAADEIEQQLGLLSYGPTCRELVNTMRQCPDVGCPGHPRGAVIEAAMTALQGDLILALRN